MRENVSRSWQRDEFARLRGSAAVVADDIDTALTLRFDFGRLTVHEGLVGVPDVTILGSTSDIRALTEVPFVKLLGVCVPRPGSAASRTALRNIVEALRRRNLKIYGLLFHPRFVMRLLRVLSRAS